MITVNVLKKTPCPVAASEIKERVSRVLRENGIQSDAETEVVIVNREEMLVYVEKYLHEKGEEAAEHPVLSFVQSELEGPFQFPPDNILHLGEIIISYPHAVDDAKASGKTLSDAVCELAEHAALHLLGIHHD